MHNFEIVHGYYESYKNATVDPHISPNDSMNNQWYLQIGRSAVEIIMAARLASNIRDVGRVLDLPCGHGRVLRHLVKLFANAEFDACDLDVDGVEF